MDRRLDSMAFVSRVLVPETARLLIMDDLGLSNKEALDVLHDSQTFGAAVYPDLDNEET
jgi:hypothetical protein